MDTSRSSQTAALTFVITLGPSDSAVVVAKGRKSKASVITRLTLAFSETLLQSAECVLRIAGADLADIEIFCVPIKNSYPTGLRVGLALAQGLADASGKACITLLTPNAQDQLTVVDKSGGKQGQVVMVDEPPQADLVHHL